MDPFFAMRHESLSNELRQIGSSFGPDEESGRIATVIMFRRLTED
jgi:hypothetical protein